MSHHFAGGAGQEEPQTQLINHLQDKQILLVLDNFEQLLAEQGETLLGDILRATLGVKFLVTSREVLNLQEEWLYPIQGLSYPPPPGEPGAEEGRHSTICGTRPASTPRFFAGG
ncbi:MAG: hypothetical protein HYR94_30010 [Chloroflexi bacterium]|nr:hypothetical protein [Chloroflexota bacterium]